MSGERFAAKLMIGQSALFAAETVVVHQIGSDVPVLELAFVRYARLTLARLWDRAHGVDPYAGDVWLIEDLGIPEFSYQPSRTITFAAINPPWLREMAKRWARWRLRAGLASPGTVGAQAHHIKRFSDYVAAVGEPLNSPERLTRELLEDYRAHVRAPELEVAARSHAAQVRVVTVGARHVGALGNRLVEHDLDLPVEPRGADESGRAEARRDLLGMRGAVTRPERVRELYLVHAMVATHEHEHEPGVLARGHDGVGLQQRPLLDAERRGDLGDGGEPRR